MKLSEMDINLLVDFGLTLNQAKLYVALLRLGTATASAITKTSKLRREIIYRVAPKLEEMGLLERVLGHPTKFRAIPITEGLSSLVNREQHLATQHIAKLQNLKSKILNQLTPEELGKQVPFEEKDRFALLAHQDRIIKRGNELIQYAQSKIDIFTPKDQFFYFFYNHLPSLNKALKKGVLIRLITEYDTRIPQFVTDQSLREKKFDVKFSDESANQYMIIDQESALFATSVESPLSKKEYLWTHDAHLLGILQSNFNKAWESALSEQAATDLSMSERAYQILEKIRPHDHVVFLYSSLQAKHDVLSNYLEGGLKKGEAGVYVASEEDPPAIRQMLQQKMGDIDAYEKSGALKILDYRDVYLIDGKFDISTTLGRWTHFYEEALKRGFKALRVTGEMACFFHHNLVKELVEYEKTLHRVLDLPMTAICAYNIELMSQVRNPINFYNEIVQAHGGVLFAGEDTHLGKIEIR